MLVKLDAMEHTRVNTRFRQVVSVLTPSTEVEREVKLRPYAISPHPSSHANNYLCTSMTATAYRVIQCAMTRYVEGRKERQKEVRHLSGAPHRWCFKLNKVSAVPLFTTLLVNSFPGLISSQIALPKHGGLRRPWRRHGGRGVARPFFVSSLKNSFGESISVSAGREAALHRLGGGEEGTLSVCGPSSADGI